MRLFYRDLGGPADGAAPLLVVLHGLYGSSRNWVGVGRGLARGFRVLALDLRNHGQSAHGAGMCYATLANDVAETLEALCSERRGERCPLHLMGHSLGGKTAMRLACSAPELVEHLWILDIAPREYHPDRAPLEAMLALDLSSARWRADAEAQMAESIDDPALRQFLLTNLVRKEEGYAWQLGLQEIAAAFEQLGANPLRAEERFTGPTDCIASATSGYVTAPDGVAIRRHFPAARIHVLEGVGHNVHVEGGERFLELVLGAREDPL